MEKKKIIAIRDFIINAEKSIKWAKKLLIDVLKEEWLESLLTSEIDTSGLATYNSDDNKIIEWVFTWEVMLWSDGWTYPVPANYSSKSKLVQWDKLKLTIDATGRMTYKQIEPIAREIKTWLLVKDKTKFQVVCNECTYDLLTAAVTHFKCEIWDKISVLVPAWKQATFAAIEALLPKE